MSETAAQPQDQELVATLFELGREVSAVLDIDELLRRIPGLIARLTSFTVFSVYMLDHRRQVLKIAYAEGYPLELVLNFRLKVGEGIVGAAVAEEKAMLVNDVNKDPRYLGLVPGVNAQLVVPLRHKKRVLGALNLLSDKIGAFSERDQQILSQFGVHIAQALANARMFEQERDHVETLETLTEIAREVAEILDLDELLSRIAILAKRVIDYRTFGILLVNEAKQVLEPKVALQYGEKTSMLNIALGEGLVGYSAQHRVPLVVEDVDKDPRYIKVLDDVRSELVVPLLLKDRCIGVFDLESPDLDAFSKKHIELLTLLGAQAAVAIENARLYAAIRDNEIRLEKEVRFAQRVQMALLPQKLPKKFKGADVAWHFAPARELGGDVYDFMTTDPGTLIVAVGDVSGKGVPAALYGSFVGEVVRGRSFRRRFMPERSSPGLVLTSLNRILHERGLEEYYCTLCYAVFDLKKRTVTFANSGLPYPIHVSHDRWHLVELPGVPLGSFAASTYDETTCDDLEPGDVFVFHSDGISETFNDEGEEFGQTRIGETALAHRDKSAKEIVEAIYGAMHAFRGDAEQTDDQTCVVVKITA